MAAWRERSWWGWGWADEALDDDACRRLAETSLRPWMPIDGSVLPMPHDPVLPPPRLIPPSIMQEAFAADSMTRASHTYGKAFRDVIRALRGRLDNPPDLVCFPRTGHDVVAALDWAEAVGAAVVPYGGGTSVVGGVEYRGDAPWVSLDLSRLGRVLEIDDVNHAVRVQAGVSGPALEQALRPHGLTLRHYPQSFEFSTVGGWIATRAAGHYATGPTRIDDAVSALRVITPQGPVESLRVPSSGAGPSTDRLFAGSEGTVGVIVEAWLRVTPRPTAKASTSVAFPAYDQGIAAMRALLQAGLRPSNCRLLDPLEAMLNAGATDGQARLLLGFEGPTVPLLDDALTLCADHGGTPTTPAHTPHPTSPAHNTGASTPNPASTAHRPTSPANSDDTLDPDDSSRPTPDTGGSPPNSPSTAQRPHGAANSDYISAPADSSDSIPNPAGPAERPYGSAHRPNGAADSDNTPDPGDSNRPADNTSGSTPNSDSAAQHSDDAAADSDNTLDPRDFSRPAHNASGPTPNPDSATQHSDDAAADSDNTLDPRDSSGSIPNPAGAAERPYSIAHHPNGAADSDNTPDRGDSSRPAHNASGSTPNSDSAAQHSGGAAGSGDGLGPGGSRHGLSSGGSGASSRSSGGFAGSGRSGRGVAGGSSGRSGDVGNWRSSFLRAPYTRDALIRLGLIVETVETACTWSRFEALHAAVIAAAQAAAPARVAVVTCRITHAYPDGPAPYFTIITPARRGAEVMIWDEIKAAVSTAITSAGGTITHHHAVGRDHLPWLERDPLFTDVLRAAKRTLDPRGILNPGALLPS
ncbi:FAD-linked oxidase C-terminal domain-containing protein [Dactylosporangium sp. NPDC050588]|uniref:FAD-linked oxidase C-terminal domain-containing protein n=1 Tax=Dactylosporangium sp. NPDC050588 TaxID=3157211 RepID=UPI0033C78C86